MLAPSAAQEAVVIVDVDWRTILLMAYGTWGAIARSCGTYRTNASRWAHGVPSPMVDRIMADRARPAWLTRDMIVHGARIRIEPAASSLAAE